MMSGIKYVGDSSLDEVRCIMSTQERRRIHASSVPAFRDPRRLRWDLAQSCDCRL